MSCSREQSHQAAEGFVCLPSLEVLPQQVNREMMLTRKITGGLAAALLEVKEIKAAIHPTGSGNPSLQF